MKAILFVSLFGVVCMGTLRAKDDSVPKIPVGATDKVIHLWATPKFEISSNIDGDSYRLAVVTLPRDTHFLKVDSIELKIASEAFIVPRELYANIETPATMGHLVKHDSGALAFVIGHGDGEGARKACIILDLSRGLARREDYTAFHEYLKKSKWLKLKKKK